MSIQAYKINVSQASLDDLQSRLARTRWPDEIDGVGWDYGTDLGYMKEFVDYWQHRYDWRKQEADLNKFSWFSAEIDGAAFPFIHERGKGPNPTPILLNHGWPDSFYRYIKLLPMLTDPARFGGDPADSFDVIVPSLIGPVKGSPQKQPLKGTADRLWKLMTQELGYTRFAAGGGDGGSAISQLLAAHYPESIIGLHMTDIGFHAIRAQVPDRTEAEKQYMAAGQMVSFQEGAYAVMLGSKPQTFAFGLNDSPVGWAALVVEKFRTWSDCAGNVENSFTKDELLTNIALHWFAGINPRGYREEWVSPSLKPDQQINAPVGLAFPPNDLTKVPPREMAERNLKDIRRWTVLPHGGHFVALEDPEPVAQDMRAFFHGLKMEG